MGFCSGRDARDDVNHADDDDEDDDDVLRFLWPCRSAHRRK